MKKKKVPLWLKMVRKVRRQLQIETQQPQETSKVWKTSKRDIAERLRNTVRKEDYE